MMGGASGELHNTGSAAASSDSAWACLLLFLLVFARVVVTVGVGLILAMPQARSLAGPATPS